VEGTLRVLHAAKESSVKRVILTSSTVAMMGEKKTGTFGPGDWTDPSSANISTYFKSKTLAEQAAWAFISDQSGETAVEMVSVNPGGVFGPPLGRDITGQTMRMVDQMLRGKMPMVPDISFPMVDVRDVAMLQVRAMTHPNVAGLRIIASKAEPRSFVEVAKILKNNGYRGPSTRIAPNLLLRIMAKFDRGAKGMVGMLGMNLGADNSQTRALFDWDPRPFEDSVVDAAAAVSAITR
jgi:dihydroflavonol-4-reductase